MVFLLQVLNVVIVFLPTQKMFFLFSSKISKKAFSIPSALAKVIYFPFSFKISITFFLLNSNLASKYYQVDSQQCHNKCNECPMESSHEVDDRHKDSRICKLSWHIAQCAADVICTQPIHVCSSLFCKKEMLQREVVHCPIDRLC